ncbi:MAG: protein translocase subunit SecD [Pseudomonadota bacterium]
MQIIRWKLWLIIAVAILCLIGAGANLLSSASRDRINTFLPDLVQLRAINLGLDLQGGAHLLLAIDTEQAFAELMDDYEDQVRRVLRRERIGYRGLESGDNEVRFSLRDPARGDAVLLLIREALPEFQTTLDEAGRVSLSMGAEDRQLRAQMMLEQSLEIIRRRIDALGTREPVIQAQGTERIIVQVPGIRDPEQLKRILGQTAKMTFHLLHENYPPGARAPASPPPGARLLPERIDPAVDEGNAQRLRYVVEKRIRVSGDQLVDAQPAIDQAGRSIVNFRFDGAGSRRFADTTQANVGRYLAIVLDGEVVSAPVIREPILGGSGQISGQFSQREVQALALILRAGALPAPIRILEERTVGPGLGQDSVDAGKLASLIALLLVAFYMLIYYGRFGVIANIALGLNIVIIVALISLLQITLTLPGIAGIVLTIGIAVDANVLIFERIREEAKRKKLAQAIENGYRRALTTIIDSNLTTLIAATLLFAFGSGPIKGFSVTLSIGIASSMFTAIMVTRLLVVLWYRRTAKPNSVATSLGF